MPAAKSKTNADARAAWRALQDHSKTQRRAHLNELFAADPRRVDAMTISHGPLRFDFAKTHADRASLAAFKALYDAVDFNRWRKQMFAGAAINQSEGRPVLHTALRDPSPIKRDKTGGDVADFLARETKRLRGFVRAVHAGKITAQDGQPYRHVLHLGIGGSALGPEMVVAALQDALRPKLDIAVVANVDGAALKPVLARLDAKRTLVVVASKTFTTTETLTNAATVMAWLRAAGIDAPARQMVAATANPRAAADFGIADDAIFAFADWVGGRYSLWSAVGLPIALALGWPAFEGLLKGAAEMDAHFKSARWPQNAPMLAAALDVWYASFWQAETRAVFAYDNRLALLVPYLQQLEMESNGKGVTRDGQAVRYSTGPIVWGGVGTDCQHAVFQLLHQGTHLVPAEFIAVRRPDHSWRGHHRQLLANCFAQSAALMRGRDQAEAGEKLLAAGVAEHDLGPLAAAKSFPGNRPSTTILIDRLTPQALGGLLAFYEHRTFAAGCLWRINSFDQMGVELGKELAKGVAAVLSGGGEASALDPSTQALLALLK
ncbi:MAG: glucose-6-phosphate isomerase [Sphingomonadales bacterium]